MSDYQIGKVIGSSGDSIIISLSEHQNVAGVEEGVPDSMTVTVEESEGAVSQLIGQPGSYIVIAIPTGMLVGMITSVDLHDSDNAGSSKRIITAVAVGNLSDGGVFERGADILPTVNAPVFAMSSAIGNSIYGQYSEGTFTLGDLSIVPGQRANIDLDAFLSRHAAILGQSGGGKSWTVASILQKITAYPQTTTVLFDLHGEYSGAFEEDGDMISGSELELPYWLMNSEELINLMIDPKDPYAANQITKFKELLQKVKTENYENQQLGLSTITVDTPVYFEMAFVIEEFRRLDIQMVPGTTGPKKGPMYGQFAALLARIESKMRDRRYDLIFHPKTYTSSASMEDLFRRILGKKSEGMKKVIVLDLSPVPFDVRTSVISLILRSLFDFAYWFRRVNKTPYPIAVFADEAHIYLNEEDPETLPARKSAERISKEGRKYGISLTVISQRPRQVSSTVLSQCNSFVCLRITNPDDQEYVKDLLPDSARGITSVFSTLRRGECVLMGEAVMMPTRIRVDKPSPPPQSEDISFHTVWTEQVGEVDVNSVIDAWRRQDDI